MNNDKLRLSLKKLQQTQSLAVLATHNQGHPYTNLVAFSATDDLKRMFFATGRATRKYANIMADNRVSMLFDNRCNDASDFREAIAVTATGRAVEVGEDEKTILIKSYLKKHPSLQEFVTSPTCAFFCVEVKTYYAVTRFQQVMELHIDQ